MIEPVVICYKTGSYFILGLRWNNIQISHLSI